MALTWIRKLVTTVIPQTNVRGRPCQAQKWGYKPLIEELENRCLLAVVLMPSPNINTTVSPGFYGFNDNQAEPTISINPTNTNSLFAASMTFHGSNPGTFNPFYKPTDVSEGKIAPDTTPGMFATFSKDGGTTWISRIFATGGPGSTIGERSLPAANADPQTTFDDYGNLFLTYLTDPVLQFGSQSAIGATTLTDNTRNWVPNMWVGRYATIYTADGPNQTFETKVITANTATQITVGEAWTPAIRDAATSFAVTVGGYNTDNAWTRFPKDQDAVVIVRSSDGGESFQFMKMLDTASGTAFGAAGVDYPGVATGPGRVPAERSVWVVWKGANNGDIKAAGAATTALGTVGDFSATQTVNNPGTESLGMPRVQVGPIGQVMVSYISTNTGQTPTNIYINVDMDGLGPGNFTDNFDEEPVTTSNIVPAGAGTATIPAQPNRGITPQVNLAWDRSANFGNANNRRVYMVYTDSVGINGPDTNVYVLSSDDSGVTWTQPLRVHSNNVQSQFLPSIAVDQVTGQVAVVWLDARDDRANNTLVKLYGTVSVDGGATFAPEIAIAQGQSNATLANKQQRGSTSAASGNNTLIDTTQDWMANGSVRANYWKNYFVGPAPLAQATVRIVDTNTATQITVRNNWAQNPGANQDYSIQPQPRPPLGLQGSPPSPIYSFDYGEYTGLAFRNGSFFPVWADNSNSTNDNVNGALRALDIYTSAVFVLVKKEMASASNGTTTTIQLGGNTVTVAPNSSLVETALLLVASHFNVSPPDSEVAFSQFVMQTQPVTDGLAGLGSTDMSLSASIVTDASTGLPMPSLTGTDEFFRLVWADELLDYGNTATLLA